MDADNLALEISKADFDLDYFTELILNDNQMRNEMVNLLCVFGQKGDINIYYHAYYIVDKASKIKPALFYEYWLLFVSLLTHRSTYHNCIGHWLLANVSKADKNDLFDKIYIQYFNGILHEKPIIAYCSIRDTIEVIRMKPQYIDYVTKLYLNVDSIVKLSKKRVELMKYDILNFFEEFGLQSSYIDKIQEFIESCKTSISPKTKRKARQLSSSTIVASVPTALN